jgi:hypothetical protein
MWYLAQASLHLKWTVAWDFLSKVISPKVPNWSPDSYTKSVLNIDSNSPRNSTSKVLTCNGPLQQIWLYAMGHCGKFSCALWATAANLVTRYGPLRRIWLRGMGHCTVWGRTVKICDNFCAVGHITGFGYSLWVIAQGLVIRNGPYWRIWLSDMG